MEARLVEITVGNADGEYPFDFEAQTFQIIWNEYGFMVVSGHDLYGHSGRNCVAYADQFDNLHGNENLLKALDEIVDIVRAFNIGKAITIAFDGPTQNPVECFRWGHNHTMHIVER